MDSRPIRRATVAPDALNLAALAKLAAISRESTLSDPLDVITALEERARRYETALDYMSHGVCLFDKEQRLVLCNSRYREIYGLTPEQVHPGATLREIVQHRVAAGTSSMPVDDYLATAASINSGAVAKTWTAEIDGGRTIQINHQRLPDGGWVATHEDITDSKEMRALAKERISLQALMDRLPDNLWVKDIHSRFLICNKVTATRMGVSDPADLIGKSDLELLSPEISGKFFADEQKVIHSGQSLIDMEEYVTDDAGHTTWLSTTKVPLYDARNQIFGVVGISRDITERRLADALRDGQAQILEMIAMSAPLEDVLDRLAHLVESQLTGIFASILLLTEDGLHLRHGAAPNLPVAYTRAIDGVRIGPSAGSCGTAAHRRETVIVADIMRDPLWADFRELAAAHELGSCWSTPILLHSGACLGTFAMYSREVREPTEAEKQLVVVATRIAGIAIERRQTEDRINFMANHDALTGLPNRALLNDRLSQAVLHAKRYNHWVAVVFIDLDNFKFVNDSLGHNAGDELLKIVAKRMVDSVRASDTVVRLGGDEFVILLFGQPEVADVISATVERLRAAIAETIHIDGHDLEVTGSLGVATYPEDGTDAQTLLANSDAAMYRAKETGRDNFQFYTPALNTRVHEKFVLQKELREAVAHAEFVLHYQPQVDLRTGRLFAVEALIRWKHPTLGMIPPNKFIPVAEETGLIVPIGDWVLHEACRQNKAWQEAGLPFVTICVNISARQFKEKDLTSRVVAALRESRLDAKYLELELTESLIMQDLEQAVLTMQELQKLGVQLSIDDFGTGYSSLAALKTFPVVRLKVDKSFIDDIPNNENDKAVASAIISLGQKLNLRVIAEGVETDEQIAFLREHNCDEMQGFHFSKPVGAREIEELLKGPSGVHAHEEARLPSAP